MGAGLLVVKSGFILFIKNYQFPLQINTLEREREREPALGLSPLNFVFDQFFFPALWRAKILPFQFHQPWLVYSFTSA
jgi:hypothetical protein